ncbi:MAG: hypothetical protein IPH76_15855, partial [Xanthomonadales bacterium]|nr:hypothetical protein [Xanthomonadales bacterium]
MAVIGRPPTRMPEGSMRRLCALPVRSTRDCTSVVPRKFVAALLPESPVLLQQAPISGALMALLRPGMVAKLPAPTSRTETSSQASRALASGASKRSSKRPSLTSTAGNSIGAIKPAADFSSPYAAMRRS